MKTNIKVYVLVALLAVLAACKVKRDPALTKFDYPENFRDVKAADTAGISDIPWKSFFTDAALKNLIDSAIRRNNDLQIAVKNIEAAQLYLRQAKLGNLPDLSLQVTVSSNRPSDNSLNGLSAGQFLGTSHIEDYTAAVALSWEADIWGKIRNQKAAALASYLQTEEARKAVQTQLVAAISQGYYNLLMLDKQLAIAKRNVLLNDSTLNIIRLQYNSGQVTLLAVQQAEAQREASAQLVPQFEQSIAIQENGLSILAGKLPERITEKAELDDIEVPETLSAGIPSAVISRRPDVRSSEWEVARADAAAGAAKASLYPSFTITAQSGLNSLKASNWFNIPASLFAQGTAGLTQPIFQRRRLKTQYEVSKVEREKSVIQFRQSVLVAVGEVSDALVRLDKLQEQENIAANRAQTLQKAIANARLLFNNGMANYLEIITAQSNVLQSELELADIKRRQLYAVVDLYRSVGGGWQ